LEAIGRALVAGVARIVGERAHSRRQRREQRRSDENADEDRQKLAAGERGRLTGRGPARCQRRATREGREMRQPQRSETKRSGKDHGHEDGLARHEADSEHKSPGGKCCHERLPHASGAAAQFGIQHCG